jgi:hypothetical protein
MEHYHYIVSGFQHEETDGRLSNFVSIDVFAKSEKEALTKAQKLVDKKNYRVASVITHDDTVCPIRGT